MAWLPMIRERQVRVSVKVDSAMPSTDAVHVAPGWIGVESVSVPELTRSPAASGSAPLLFLLAAAGAGGNSAAAARTRARRDTARGCEVNCGPTLRCHPLVRSCRLSTAGP